MDQRGESRNVPLLLYFKQGLASFEKQTRLQTRPQAQKQAKASLGQG